MDNKLTHGKTFRKIRQERGIKLKEAAGNAISDQTLRRFEMDETSVSIKTLEELWENIGIRYDDYFLEYDDDRSGRYGIYEEAIKHMKNNNTSAIMTLFVNELKKEDITMAKRIEICQITDYISANAIPPIVTKNAKIVFKHLMSVVNNLSLTERHCLSSIFFAANPGDIPIEFVRRILKEDLKIRPGDTMISGEKAQLVFLTLIGEVGYLSRSGYYEEAEVACLEAIDIIRNHFEPFALSRNLLPTFYVSLAQIQLRQNKKEGVELANKCIRQLDASIELYNLPGDKDSRSAYVTKFYLLNKTGIDFDF